MDKNMNERDRALTSLLTHIFGFNKRQWLSVTWSRCSGLSVFARY